MTPTLLSWVTLLDGVDQAAFYTDLGEAVATHDAAVIEECLRQWRLTAEAMTNAELRDRLLGTDAD